MTEIPSADSGAPAPSGPTQNPPPAGDLSRLRRSRTDRKIAGVAGGLARHFNIDPTIVRVLFVVLAIFGGAGLLAYGAAWLLVPEEDTGETVLVTSDRLRNALLIGVAAAAVLIGLGSGWDGFPWLLVVLLVLAVVVTRGDRGANRVGPAGTGSGPYDARPGAVPDGSGEPPRYGYPNGPAYPPAYPPAPARPRYTGPILFGPTLALIALALGTLGLVDAAQGGIPDAAYPAAALGVTGLMLLLGAFYGRPGGLILLGFVAAVATLGAAIAEPGFSGDRDLVVRPASASAVADSYRVPVGRVELDLTRISEVEGLDGRTITLSGNVGELVVVVPDDIEVTADARIDLGGQIDLGDRTSDGWAPGLRHTLSAQNGTPRAYLDLELDLEAGHIEVRQQS